MIEKYINNRLKDLCKSLNFNDEQIKNVSSTMNNLTKSWLPDFQFSPNWKSFITDEHYPIEFSLGLEENDPELRFLIETQTKNSSLIETWEAGLETNNLIHSLYGTSLDNFNKVKHLFYPNNKEALYSLWHGVIFNSFTLKPDFKIYLNPAARGENKEKEIISEALSLLGYKKENYSFINNLKVFGFLSFDLSNEKDSRVKIYNRVNNISCQELYEQVNSSFSRNEIENIYSSVGASIFDRLPIHICTGLNNKHGRMLKTIYFPIRSYAENDKQAASIIMKLMSPFQQKIYQNVINGYSLSEESKNKQTYFALRKQNGVPRITIYLSP